MATARLPQDFKEFLKLLKDERVQYLLIGGYAVGYYGYPRATADMDVWIAVNSRNAARSVKALRRFGMAVPGLSAKLFLEKDKIVRMGVPPIRIEMHTGISGVDFDPCYARRQRVDLDGIEVNLIGLEDLKANKRASGRHVDLEDLEHLP
jgi:predicted nucleotidyltransferase